jgi:AraC family transcriptional regulator
MRPQRAARRIEPPRFEERGPLIVSGLSGIFTAETRDRIPALWKRLAPSLGKIPGQVGNVAYGLSGMDTGAIHYLAGVEVAEDAELPEDFARVRLTASTYAVFEHRGHVSSIPQAVGEIGCDWLANSGWVPADNFRFIQRYGVRSIDGPPAVSLKS